MNQNEKKFYDSLIEKGVNQEEITFFSHDSPDFIVGDIGYEVKRKIEGHIFLNKIQIKKILKKELKSFFLIMVDEDYIIEEALLTKEILDKKYIGDTTIYWGNEEVIPFFQKIEGKTIYNWKETITHNETIRGRLEEALRDNTLKHLKK